MLAFSTSPAILASEGEEVKSYLFLEQCLVPMIFLCACAEPSSKNPNGTETDRFKGEPGVMDPIAGCTGLRTHLNSCEELTPFGESTNKLLAPFRNTYEMTLDWTPENGPLNSIFTDAPQENVVFTITPNTEQPGCGFGEYWHVPIKNGELFSPGSGHCHDRLDVESDFELVSSGGSFDEKWTGKLSIVYGKYAGSCNGLELRPFRMGNRLSEFSGAIDDNSFRMNPSSGWSIIGFDIQVEIAVGCEDASKNVPRGRLLLIALSPENHVWYVNVARLLPKEIQ